MLLEARAVELLLEPLRLARAQRRARDRVLERDPRADQAVGKLARSGRDLELRPAHELDQHGARRDERAAALRDELEDDVEVGAAADRLRDLRRRVERRDRALELVLALAGAGVAPAWSMATPANSASSMTASSSSRLNSAPPSFSVR